MNRETNEVLYVLDVLRRSRQAVIANPRLFDPDALERIDKAIARLEGVTRQLKAA